MTATVETKHTVVGVKPFVDDLAPRFTRLSDEVWGCPELRWEEHRSLAKQLEAAREFGGRVTEGVGGVPTAFRAEWGSGTPVIGFLGEFDALAGLSQVAGSAVKQPDPENTSGNGHGCGHNLLGSGSLLAAVATARYLEANGLEGTVRYFGCPAEEGAAGKTFMVAGGAFDGVDAAVSWHPMDVLMTAQWLSLAYAQLYFRFTGIASHAGAAPQHGRSALDAAELMNVGANFLREHMGDFDRIHYAFIDAGGTSPNVVQSTAELYYIVRSPKVATMRALVERIKKIAEGAALMTETQVEVEFDGACAEYLPNEVLERALHAHTVELGGVPFDEADQAFAGTFVDGLPRAAMLKVLGLPKDTPALLEGVLPLPDPRHRMQMTGSTDVADVSWTVPTVQITGATWAIGTPPHSWQAVAQGKSPSAHKGMIHAATVMAAMAADLFTNRALLDAAKAEHAATLAETPYDHPIPEGTVPPPLRAGYRPA